MSERDDTAVKVWLQDIYNEHGYLTPEIVRDAARDETSPGHAIVFNVSPSEAAEGYYLDQARRMIQRIRIVTETPGQSSRTVRFYHSIPGQEESEYIYKSVDDLVKHPDQLELARNEAVRRLKQAESAIESLDALVVGTASGQKTRKALKGIRDARAEIAAA